jgi:hypothetical protein
VKSGVDETFVGSKARNMHKNVKRRKALKGGGPTGKAIVLGIPEREIEGKPKKIRVTVIPDRARAVMQENVIPHVETGSQIYSDDAGYYWRMDDELLESPETWSPRNLHQR